MAFRRASKWKTLVAERKRIEQMLRHLGMVTEKTDVGIIATDLQGIVHFANTAWAKMHGYGTSDELLGKSMEMFHAAEQMKSAVIPLIEQTKRKGEFTGTAEHLRRNGTTFPTRIKMAVLKDQRNKVSGVMTFVMDITENKQLEERLGETTRELDKLKEQIGRLQDQVTERERTEGELQEYSDQLEQRVKELLTELRASDRQAEHKIGRHDHAENISAQNSEEEELKELGIIFDPQKLKALADMAKRLR